MTTVTLESLGFSKTELEEKLLDRLCSQVLQGVSYDEDGNEFTDDSRFRRKLDEAIQKRIDETVTALADKHVLPNVTSFIENLVLQETNKWGERTGKPVTFIEYLTQRADAYMREEVDFDGKNKEQSGGYSWRGTQTRITHLVHKHLHYSIENAMKAALQTANNSIVEGLEKTVQLKLKEFTANLQAVVKVEKER